MPVLPQLRRVIAAVPRGKVITYGQVAVVSGFPGAARLTVRALQSAEGLPWHRVVAAGGRIALPDELGREQRMRLETEGVTFRGGRVRMELHGWLPRTSGKRKPRGAQTASGGPPGPYDLIHSRGREAENGPPPQRAARAMLRRSGPHGQLTATGKPTRKGAPVTDETTIETVDFPGSLSTTFANSNAAEFRSCYLAPLLPTFSASDYRIRPDHEDGRSEGSSPSNTSLTFVRNEVPAKG